MNTLSARGARHFTAGFISTPGTSISTFRYVASSRRTRGFVEGSQAFTELRSALLRDADRHIFLAGSNFIRSIELLRPSSSAWAVVGLYYSAWYAAHAILGLVGCWIAHGRLWIDVVNTNPGAQELELHRTPYAPNFHNHRLFWHAYYSAVPPLANLLSPAAAMALKPVSANEQWFIELRNKVNYRPTEAFALMANFESSYNPATIPKCFPGELNSAYQVARSFLDALRELSIFTKLGTDVFPGSVNRRSAVRKMVNGPKSRPLTAFARTERGLCEF